MSEKKIFYTPKTNTFRFDYIGDSEIYVIPQDVKILKGCMNGIYIVKFAGFIYPDWKRFDVAFSDIDLEYLGFDRILKGYCEQHSIEFEKIWYLQKNEISYEEANKIKWFIRSVELPPNKYSKIYQDLEVLKEYENN